MPTRESKRVMEHRTAKFEQQNFLVPIGGKSFIKVMAWLHGMTATEFIRTAILEKAGLNIWPCKDEIPDAESRNNVRVQLLNLQNQESFDSKKARKVSAAALPAGTTMITPSDALRLRSFCMKLMEIRPDAFEMPIDIELSSTEMQALRRILSMIH